PRRDRRGQRRPDREAAGVAGRPGGAVRVPRQAGAGMDGDEVEVAGQPIQSPPLQGEGWVGMVSRPKTRNSGQGASRCKATQTGRSCVENSSASSATTPPMQKPCFGGSCAAGNWRVANLGGSTRSWISSWISPASNENSWL